MGSLIAFPVRFLWRVLTTLGGLLLWGLAIFGAVTLIGAVR